MPTSPPAQAPSPDTFAALADRVRACCICIERPEKTPLPHAPRPVLRGSSGARVLVAGQAPGTRVHATGLPFNDPSGDRLRGWMAVDRATFYDERRIAVVPMGFCFPGQDANGGDLPPRRECAAAWHDTLMQTLQRIELILAIGLYAQRWHLRRLGLDQHLRPSLSETVGGWRSILAASNSPRVLVLPHPSWRNTGWLKKHPWFEAELLPVLRTQVAHALS